MKNFLIQNLIFFSLITQRSIPNQSDEPNQNKTKINSTTSKNFKIGYLYGLNQYHAEDFSLSYLLDTNDSNTIAIFVNEFESSNQSNTNNINKTSRCSKKFLKIETISKIHNNDMETFQDNKIDHKTPKMQLLKICDNDDLLNASNRNFLIKTNTQLDDLTVKKTLVLITYFKNKDSLTDNADLFDFKINFEFIKFDWNFYKQGSVCDFVYNFNLNGKMKQNGFIRNPEGSIFYSLSDDYVKCRYRILAKQNQYIKLSFEQIDFNADENQNNVYFTDTTYNVDFEKKRECDNIQKRILIKELNQPWSESDDNDVINNSFDSNYEYYDFEVNAMEKDEKKDFKTKMCLCKLSHSLRIYNFTTKYDAVEIEYQVKLRKADSLNEIKVNFLIKYEIFDRKCEEYIIKKSDQNKGRIFSDRVNNFGIQKELLKIVEKDSSNYQLENRVTPVSEDESLKYLLKKNLNFFCRFNIEVPANQFVNIEFTEIFLPQECIKDYVQIFTNYSKTQIGLNDYFLSRPAPFIKLCSSSNISKKNEKKIVVAEFYDSSVAKSSFGCIKSKNKICLMTSDINNALNPVFKPKTNTIRDISFNNNFFIEIASESLDGFYFEIKYHFYSIDVASIFTKVTSEKSSFACDFKCGASNETSRNLTICLSKSLVCDKEVDCIYDNFDEQNCKLKFFRFLK